MPEIPFGGQMPMDPYPIRMAKFYEAIDLIAQNVADAKWWHIGMTRLTAYDKHPREAVIATATPDGHRFMIELAKWEAMLRKDELYKGVGWDLALEVWVADPHPDRRGYAVTTVARLKELRLANDKPARPEYQSSQCAVFDMGRLNKQKVHFKAKHLQRELYVG